MAEAGFSRANRDRLAWLGILVAALLLRLHELDVVDVWVDEANAILTAREPLRAMFGKLALDSSPPLLFVLLHGWIAAFGDGIVALRLVSVATGVALTAATWWAGRELVSPRAGAWAALFVAVSPLQIFYSQQVRPYALLPLLGLLSVAFLVRHLRDGLPRDRALWLATTVAALYTHNFAVYLPLVAAALILLSGRALSEWRTWLACAGVGLLAWLPWAPTFLAQLENPDHYAWFLADWEEFGPAGVVVRTLRSFSPSVEYAKFAGIEQYVRWGGWPTWGVVALAAWGAVALVRERRSGDAAWPVVFLAVPVVGAVLVSSLLTPHYVPGRVDQMVFPAFALLVGAGLAALRPPVLAGVAGVAILAIALTTKWTLYPTDQGQRFYRTGGETVIVDVDGGDRAMAREIAARWRPGDVILTTSLTRASLEYYLDRDGRAPRFVSFPRDTALHLGSQNDARWLADRAALVREADAVVAEVRARLAPGGQVFLVRVRSEVNTPFRDGPMARRHGFARVESIGHFGQTGAGALVELSVHTEGTGHGSDPRAGRVLR
jgi:hypothetical protein